MENQSDYTEIVEEIAQVFESKEQDAPLTRLFKSLLERLRGGQKARDEPLTGGFKSLGNGLWVGWYSNNFEDYQKEWFPSKATDEFIARVDRKEVDAPELYFWHYPYRFGAAKAIARIALDGSPQSPSFTVAVGTYDDTPAAKAFEKAMSNKVYPMSHGFHYAPAFKQDGAYHYYNTFEVSPLPPHAPANPYTLFEDGKAMPILDEAKRKEFVSLLGEDFVKDMEAKAETRAKEIAATGVATKEMTMIDTEARTQLEALNKQMADLTEAVKAKMPKADDEDDDAKKKKADADGAFKKEVSDAIKQLATSQSQLAQNFKDFLDLTPRRASKSADTLVPAEDAALQELQKGATGKKSNEEMVFHAAFGSVLGGLQNGS